MDCDSTDCDGVGSVSIVLCVGLVVGEQWREGAVQEIITLDEGGVGLVVSDNIGGGVEGDENCGKVVELLCSNAFEQEEQQKQVYYCILSGHDYKK